MKSLCKALAVLCLLPLLATCEQIIGLPDRELIRDAGPPAVCEDYCKDVTANCEPELDAYASENDCLAMCSYMPAGEADDTSTHTASCRAYYAAEAANLESDAKNCPSAAPGGGSPTISSEQRCGDNCEAYCQLQPQICPESKQSNCLEKCRALPDRGTFSATKDFMGGDTIQCRLSHLTAAAQYASDGEDAERKVHCSHSLLRAGLGERPHCDVPDKTVPNCKDYCTLIMQACESAKVYDTQQQCENFCEKGLVKGTNTVTAMIADKPTEVQDQTRDTLACRRWHGYYAYDDMAANHCPHAGPTGDGHCGKPICQVYCDMLKRGCEKQFNAEFPMGQPQCLEACKGVPGVKELDMGYKLGTEEVRTNTLQCRFRYLVDVFNDMPAACDRAVPKVACSR